MKDPCVSAHAAYLKRINRRPANNEDYLDTTRSYVRWGNAVPAQECLDFIAARQQPVVELGSGLGYLAYKLQKVGVNVTAVDMAPNSCSENHIVQYKRVTNQDLKIPELYLPVIEQGAMEYLIKNEGCPGKTLLMIHPPTEAVSFLWMINWKTMFKGDCIMFAISDPRFDLQFRQVLNRTKIWQETESIDMPKYGLASPGVSMNFLAKIISKKNISTNVDERYISHVCQHAETLRFIQHESYT